MPRPTSDISRSTNGPTLTAEPQSALASALSPLAPTHPSDLQEAARGLRATCSAAPEPEDHESDGGLSEDEHDDRHLIRRDIMHNQSEAFRAVVAPISCTANRSTSSSTDEDAVPTRPASVRAQAESSDVPTATQLVEPSSTQRLHNYSAKSPAPAADVVPATYTEDDWDKPQGQTSFWYDDPVPYYYPTNSPPQDGLEGHRPVAAVSQPQPIGFGGEPEPELEGYLARRQSTEPQPHGNYSSDESAEHEVTEYQEYQYQREASQDDCDPYNPECECAECAELFQQRQQNQLKRDLWGWQRRHNQQERVAIEAFQRQHQYQRYRAMVKTDVPAAPTSRRPSVAGGDQFQSHVEQQNERQRRQDEQRKAMLAIHPRGAKGGNPTAVVACCYFKQKGYCKMGPDCWYSHDADESTPCHYGALCKAGHKHLVKPGNSAAPTVAAPPQPAFNNNTYDTSPEQQYFPAAAPVVAAPYTSAGYTGRQQGQAQRVISAPQQRAAAPASSSMKPSSISCAFCGTKNAVRTQEFPVYNGNERETAVRAHCTQCLRTYAL